MSFVYGTVTRYGQVFQNVQLDKTFLTRRTPRMASKNIPTTPHEKRMRPLTDIRFGLIPFRSPLLRESQLLSVPRGTKMFQFPRLYSPAYVFS